MSIHKTMTQKNGFQRKISVSTRCGMSQTWAGHDINNFYAKFEMTTVRVCGDSLLKIGVDDVMV